MAKSRERAGLSQEELCSQADLHPTYISALERGQRNPTYESLAAVAEALGMTIAQLSGLADALLLSRR